jgi:hypothetical protein
MPGEDWISDVMESVEHVETPRNWIWYSLCSAISAAASNNYHMLVLKGTVMVKPNIYVILLGESGLGKEFPIFLAQELVQRAEVTRVIAGRSSIQAIVKELSTAKTRPDKPPITDSRAFIVNGELSTAIIKDPDALTLLTDLYDRKTKWANTLKGTGIESLKDTYVTALFGSSYAHFQASIPQENVEGGYIGRNFIVEETKLFQQTDLFSQEEGESKDALEEIAKKFVPHLEQINKSSGRIIPDSESMELFNEWRRKWRADNPPGSDKTGFKPRVPFHVLKLAMCLVLSDYEAQKTLVMSRKHIEEAIDRVTTLVYGTQKITDGKGLDPLSAQTKMVLDFLINAEGNCLTRKQLLTKGYGNYSTVVLDQILENLIEINWIRRERIFAGKRSDWNIFLSGKPLEQYIEFMERAREAKIRRSLQREQV